MDDRELDLRLTKIEQNQEIILNLLQNQEEEPEEEEEEKTQRTKITEKEY